MFLFLVQIQAAAQFPSSNRSSIIEEIKEEFRASRALTDQEEVWKQPSQHYAERRAMLVESGVFDLRFNVQTWILNSDD